MEEHGLEFLQFAFRWYNCLLIREVKHHFELILIYEPWFLNTRFSLITVSIWETDKTFKNSIDPIQSHQPPMGHLSC